MSGSWQPFTLNMIPGVPQALDAVGQAASTLTGLLDALAGLLEMLAQLAQFMADAMQAAMAAICALIQEIIDQIFNLLNTGISFYLDKGPFFMGGQPDGLEGFLSRWRASFDDLGDAHRPQFAGNANVSAMLFLVGANDLPSLQRLLALLGLLFGRPDLVLDGDFYSADLPSLVEAGMSTRLGEVIPPFQRLGEILMQAMGMLKVGDGYAGLLSKLAQVIAEKAAVLAAISDEIQSLVDAITALIESAGLYVLHADGGSLPNLIANVGAAENVPPWNYESYVAGVCLLAGTAEFGPVVELLGG
jgi:hypothetical protein